MLADGSSLSLMVVKSLVQQPRECSHFSFWAIYPDGHHQLLLCPYLMWLGPIEWACSQHFLNGKPSTTGLPWLTVILHHFPKGLGHRGRLIFNSAWSHWQHTGFKTIIKMYLPRKPPTYRKSYRWSCSEHQPPFCKSWDQKIKKLSKSHLPT